MISIQNISKKYNTLEILKSVSIVGPSGAGKSTLLHIMGSLMKADSGSVLINHTDITSLSSNALAKFRNQNIGFIFQFHHLLPEFTALENVLIPTMMYLKDPTAESRAKELLDYLNLSHRLHHKPTEMSGGEQQRVAVARALINNPLVILADEPSGNLDTKNAEELHLLFQKLRDEKNQTFVIVTHNDHLAETSDRVIKMRDGKVEGN
jgi:lipoprotein-releasing system ATP-binding protein